MVTILSAFLSLAIGVHPVEVDPIGDVVTVEFVLDGVSVAVLDAEPWVVDCDFGAEMAPHELVVIGRDSDGQEIARASRWINLPRHSAAGWRAIAGAGSEESDLTTLVFELQGRKPPAPSEMEGWLTKDGKALEVVAVERGGADVVVVQEATMRLWGDLLKVRRGVLESGNRNALKERLSSGLNYEDRLRVMLPVGETQAGASRSSTSALISRRSTTDRRPQVLREGPSRVHAPMGCSRPSRIRRRAPSAPIHHAGPPTQWLSPLWRRRVPTELARWSSFERLVRETTASTIRMPCGATSTDCKCLWRSGSAALAATTVSGGQRKKSRRQSGSYALCATSASCSTLKWS